MEISCKINSLDLQKRFQDIYKNFFSKHDIVLSGDGVLTWWLDLSRGISTLQIKQKLPIKIFFGANPDTSGRITFGTIIHYNQMEDTFEEDDFSVFFKNDVEPLTAFIESFLLKNGYTGGMEINVLTEIPKWHGFWFLSVTSVLLTYLLHLMTGDITSTDLLDFGTLEAKPVFGRLYAFSMKLSQEVLHGKDLWATNYVVMNEGESLPIVHLFQNPCVDTPKQNDTFRDSLSRFLGISLGDIHKLPVHYGVIFSWIRYDADEADAIREQTKKENEKLNTFFDSILDASSIDEKERQAFRECLKFDTDEALQRHINYTNLKILNGFDSMLREPLDDGALTKFIDVIKSVGLASLSYQWGNKLIFSIYYLFYKYRQFENEEIGIFPFNSWKIGGSLFFVTKGNKSHTTLLKVLETLRSEGHLLGLDYASWRDGYSCDGIRLEQSVADKHYSAYIKQWTVLFRDSTGDSYYGEYEAIMEIEGDCILLDMTKRRIYIQGSKLTSKEIHSQNTTIDMLYILLDHIGEEVSNAQLPVSTYSKNKNEILSKIILPIRRLSKEHFWVELALVCNWGISEYYMKLEKQQSIRIGILEKAAKL